MARKLAAGNWKMNGTLSALPEIEALADAHPDPAVDLLICPPVTLLAGAAGRLKGSAVALGGQDCHAEAAGAHTGDISASMLAEAGAAAVIVGHSERRENHNESSELVCAKAQAAHEAGLSAVICLGETEAERDGGRTLAVIGRQLDLSVPAAGTGANTVIAYEPVWAIGTGRTPTAAQIGEVHAFLRGRLTARFGPATGQAIRLLYGGSVKASNAAEIFAVAEVDGALVGGASLTAAAFSPIVTALEAAAG